MYKKPSSSGGGGKRIAMVAKTSNHKACRRLCLRRLARFQNADGLHPPQKCFYLFDGGLMLAYGKLFFDLGTTYLFNATLFAIRFYLFLCHFSSYFYRAFCVIAIFFNVKKILFFLKLLSFLLLSVLTQYWHWENLMALQITQ